MSRLFTIAEGLENMGALRTGGQGSVYKGRRIGPIFTAVKILPTPIHTESADDRNFLDFQNEVEKLKKVNEEPNPNVVKILNSGITESGSFPFIEMEFIEGPDLEELLQPPHDPVFALREVIKVADQLASALAHCHKVGVKHGDIKSNNVKFNIHTGNYVLLDFGLAVMSDEQRRTSLRHAGAIEFMAPEQNEGHMLFQTDVYSYGVILYELLGGRVPFPLRDKGETSRNGVMMAHLETPIPDVVALRKEHLPGSWPDDRKHREMQVPGWLLSVIATCLEKNPENRYSSGVALHEAIIQGSTLAVKNDEAQVNSVTVLQGENERLLSLVRHYQEQAIDFERSETALRAILTQREAEIRQLTDTARTQPTEYQRPPEPFVNRVASRPNAGPAHANTQILGVPRVAFLVGLMLLIGLGVWLAYSQFSRNPVADNPIETSVDTPLTTGDQSDNDELASATNEAKPESEPIQKADNPVAEQTRPRTIKPEVTSEPLPEQTPKQPVTRRDNGASEADPIEVITDGSVSKAGAKRYTLASQYAYFHNEPDAATRRAANINIWNNAKLTPLAERNGFIYVVYTNEKGQISRGWLLKSALKPIRN
ncbi:MAG TPA: serine/threonine-protein kinase [Fibrella sp.]